MDRCFTSSFPRCTGELVWISICIVIPAFFLDHLHVRKCKNNIITVVVINICLILQFLQIKKLNLITNYHWYCRVLKRVIPGCPVLAMLLHSFLRILQYVNDLVEYTHRPRWSVLCHQRDHHASVDMSPVLGSFGPLTIKTSSRWGGKQCD